MEAKKSKPWPMPRYMQAWQAFRDKTDEDEVTASCILRSPSWPKKEGIVICDIGCGDGRLVKNMLRSNYLTQRVYEVRLIDPVQDLLTQAAARIRQAEPGIRAIPRRDVVRNAWPKYVIGADVILMVHVVYLITSQELKALLRRRPPRSTIYIVLDAPDSVFTALWQVTAPRYHERVLKAHAAIRSILGWKENQTPAFIQSRLPIKQLKCLEWSPWLLSLLCYRDMTGKGVDEALKATVSRIIDEFTGSAHNLVCKSACYEIPPAV